MPIAKLGSAIGKKLEPIKDAFGKGKAFLKERGEQADKVSATIDKIDARRSAQSAADREKRDAEKSAQAKRAADSKSSEGAVKKAKGGSVSSASKRADGCVVKGKTKGRFI